MASYSITYQVVVLPSDASNRGHYNNAESPIERTLHRFDDEEAHLKEK